MADRNTPSEHEPEFAHQRALYEQLESQTAEAFEQLVSKPSFGVLLARTGENVAAISKIVSDSADLALRNLRLAGRADVTRLARQLNRTEDKLERLLQEIEELRGELAQRPSGSRRASGNGSGGTEAKPRAKRTRETS
jgi:hypothetical protein